ncbi:MAG: aspartate--tRNA ligase [Bacteroidota bacterium]|nr:aspartate--tRNA ligase [Bacteroidota bacterium]
MLRTHTCGELNESHVGETVILCGWIQTHRNLGAMCFIDLRDRFGITQLSFNENSPIDLLNDAKKLAREFVVMAEGKVIERSSKNKQIPTGGIEIQVKKMKVLSTSKTPPFTIENNTDGGDELRMRYRYLDLRRPKLQENILLRHKASQSIRNFLSHHNFLEIETPYLIKSTPEGARDFVVPSRMNENQFYALPQSPQTFKQLLMVGGYDRYFQIVRCFRDEDLRADRQPEFTQIDCEMSFVNQEDIYKTFEELAKYLFKETLGIELPKFETISYEDSMHKYGNDKPDLRFDMPIQHLEKVAKGHGFKVFDDAEKVVGIVAKGAALYTRKQLDFLVDFVKKPQIGAKGLVYCKYNEEKTFKSSIDKFFGQNIWQEIAATCDFNPGDLLLILSGSSKTVLKQMSELRLEMGNQLNLVKDGVFKPLWVVDFPLLEWDEENQRYHAMHHPFTSPKVEDLHYLSTAPNQVKANAYDMVINGVEVGGGSIRIHDREMQEKMLSLLGFSDQEAKDQFGFLMEAFEYGAPPHGGIAFGFDRLCSLLTGENSIRDVIAFPKNNQGRDIMIDAPSPIDNEQRKELGI